MRLFVAAYPPPAVSVDLAEAVAGLALSRPVMAGRSRRVVSSAQWHLTMVFLGEVADADAVKAVQAVAAGAATSLPVDIVIRGGGTFGRGRFTRIWAGIGGDVAGLRAMARNIRREVHRARLPCDPKTFRPHLTLARPGDRMSADEVAADTELLTAYSGPTWTVSEVCLVRSHLGPRPTYDTLGVLPFAATASRPTG